MFKAQRQRLHKTVFLHDRRTQYQNHSQLRPFAVAPRDFQGLIFRRRSNEIGLDGVYGLTNEVIHRRAKTP